MAKDGKRAQARPRLAPKRQKRSMAAVVEIPRWGTNQRRVGEEIREEEREREECRGREALAGSRPLSP